MSDHMTLACLFLLSITGLVGLLNETNPSMMIRNWLLSVILFYISIRDAKFKKITNDSIGILIALWILFLPLISGAGKIILSAACVCLILLAIVVIATMFLKRKVMGAGDVKLIFALSLFLGPEKSVLLLCLFPVFGLVTIIMQQMKNDKEFPLAPAICFSGWMLLISGPEIMSTFINL